MRKIVQKSRMVPETAYGSEYRYLRNFWGGQRNYNLSFVTLIRRYVYIGLVKNI